MRKSSSFDISSVDQIVPKQKGPEQTAVSLKDAC